MSITEKLQALGYTLPAPAQPAFNYVPVTLHQGIAYVSGQLPKEEGEVRIQGKLGDSVDLDQASHAARVCILQALACLQAELGDLNRIAQILKVNGYVASAPGFNAQPKVLDAASTLLVELFGPAGRHARAAVGVAELPRNAPVEIELTVAVTTGESQ